MGLQKNCSERRQNERERLRLAVGGDGIGVDGAGIADVRTAVESRIGVEDFPPGARPLDADPVMVPWHGRHVADYKYPGLIGQAQKGEY